MPVVKPSPVSRKVVPVRPQKVRRNISLREYYEQRNRILIIRAIGGLGDIFMHRMMFEDFKRIMPDAEVHFACPQYYHDALLDHPFIDRILGLEGLNRDEYIVTYNTTTACGREEMRLAPFSGPHRSDIWAAHCGVVLTKHDMHITLSEEEKAWGRELIEQNRDRVGPAVCVVPVSAMQTKNLLDHQLLGLIDGLRKRDCYAFALHNCPIPTCYKHNVPMVAETKIRRWMAVINQADYIVSVDTAAFHCAGGMAKPLVGIFTWADGRAYGKYYDFFLVQKHRADDPSWTCGPCYNWPQCPKSSEPLKPCLTELTSEMILNAVDKMMAKWPVANSI